MKKILLFLLLFCFTAVFAKAIALKEPLTAQNILKSAEVFIDAEGNKSVEEVLANPSLFKPFDAEKIILGYTKEQVWVKFSVENNTTHTLLPVLEIDNPMLDYIHLYTLENNRVASHESKGVLLPLDFRGPLNFNFELSTPPNSVKDYLLHVSSISCALYFNATLMNQEAFFTKELTHQLMLSLFFGLMIGLIVYNFFLYLFTKERLYFYYVMYQLFIVINHGSYSTITRHILAPWPWFMQIDAFLSVYYVLGCAVLMLLFTREFLQLQQYRWIEWSFRVFFILALIIVILSFMYFYLIDLATYLVLLTGFYLIGLSIHLVFRHKPHAKYFVIGWGVALAGYISLGFYQLGISSPMSVMPYFYEGTVAFEALLFSVMLAQRLNHAKALEQAVQTQKVLTKELHHRVKNNMQMIISLYRLKFADISDARVREKLLECEANVVAISKVHQSLYAQDNLHELNTQAYFDQLIQSLYASFRHQNIEIVLNCSVSLSPQKAIYSAIILNELVTNSMKYAFEQGEKGSISVSLYEQNKKIIFIIEDDGKGYDQHEQKDSFGLFFVSALAHDELLATLEVESDNGTRYIITWDA